MTTLSKNVGHTLPIIIENNKYHLADTLIEKVKKINPMQVILAGLERRNLNDQSQNAHWSFKLATRKITNRLILHQKAD